ncbi:hypothetical protein CCHR01_19593 [Colletotrichum chrysophilum]|uniref:Uncharacterized protein n=1 Tax=Colletotrichum chrysophilum TaxID=1836956 RepID=A0AAD9A2A2_9PEZI|nr:hypothetical protein CCHR01_19593 [Colletotrichum chrysophilum]
MLQGQQPSTTSRGQSSSPSCLSSQRRRWEAGSSCGSGVNGEASTGAPPEERCGWRETSGRLSLDAAIGAMGGHWMTDGRKDEVEDELMMGILFRRCRGGMEVGAMVVEEVRVEHEMGNGRAGNNGHLRFLFVPKEGTVRLRRLLSVNNQNQNQSFPFFSPSLPERAETETFDAHDQAMPCIPHPAALFPLLLRVFCTARWQRLVWTGSTDALVHRCTRNKSHAQDGFRMQARPLFTGLNPRQRKRPSAQGARLPCNYSEATPSLGAWETILESWPSLHLLLLASNVVIISIDAPLCAGQKSGTRAKENLTDWAGPNPATRVLFLLNEYPSRPVQALAVAVALFASASRLPPPAKRYPDSEQSSPALEVTSPTAPARPVHPAVRALPYAHALAPTGTASDACNDRAEESERGEKKDSTPVLLAADQSTGPFPNPAHITTDIQRQLHLEQAAFLLLASASPRFNSARNLKQQTSWTGTRHIQF